MSGPTVAVGSTNPTKLRAVRKVFTRVWRSARVVGVEVDSGVSVQPIGAKEIISGAINRARNALKKTGADFGVGIEGGVAKFGDRWYNLGFVAVVSKEGQVGLGSSGWFECPPRVLKELRKGRELGDVMDELTGTRGIKFGKGTIGTFTRGYVDRVKLYEHGLWMALCRFLTPEFFEEGKE